MLRVASRAAVAAGENLAAVDQAVEHRLDGGGNRGRHGVDGIELGVGAVFEMLGNAGDQIHIGQGLGAVEDGTILPHSSMKTSKATRCQGFLLSLTDDTRALRRSPASSAAAMLRLLARGT